MNEVDFSDFSKKVEIWSAQDKKDDYFDSDPQDRIKRALKKTNEECIIVGEYKVKPDAFETLGTSSKCKMPMWLTFVVSCIGIVFIIASLAAIFTTTLIPKKYASYNEACDTVKLCDTDKNLNCTNSLCACSSSSLIWDSTNKKCDAKKSYGETCTSTSDCVDSIGLFCSITSSGCNCPSTSVAYMCDCQITQYYDGTQRKCVDKLAYGSSCTFDQQCVQGMNYVCKTDGTCGCANTHYYFGTACVSKSGNTASCSASVPCDDTKGLSCISSYCGCSTGYYFDTVLNKCAALKSILESCSTTGECNSAQGLQCIGTCQCATGSFWSQGSSSCIVCSSGFTDYQSSGCFKIDTTLSNWDTSKTTCNSSASTLSVASTSAEFNLLQNFLADSATSGPFWVGLSKDASSGNFKWIDNTVLAASSYFWCSSEPSTSISSACVMIISVNGEYCLKVDSCTNQNKFICKKTA